MTTLTTGDTAPDLDVRLVDLHGPGGTPGGPIVLTGAAVQFHVARPDGTVITRAGTVVDATDGRVRLEWQAGDLTVSGWWSCEVQVTYAGGDIQTVGAVSFHVRDQIA